MKSKNNLKGSLKTFGAVLKYLKIYRIHFIVSIIFTAVTVGLSLYIPILVGQAIDKAVGIGNVDMPAIATILMKILVSVIINAVLTWIINILNNRMTYGIAKNIRHKAFVRIQEFPVSFIDANRTGDIISRTVTDVDVFSDGLLMGFTQFFNGIMTIVGTLIFMFIYSAPVAVIVVLVTPLSLFVASFIAKKTHSMFKLQSEIRSEQTSLIDEMITNHKTVVAYGQEEKIQKDFDEINQRLGKASLRATFFSSITNPSTRFVNSVVYALVALTGALLCIAGGTGMSVGRLSSFLSYATQYTKPFNEISGVITELQNALACAERVFDLIEKPVQTADKQDPHEPDNIEGIVEFSDVCTGFSIRSNTLSAQARAF